MTLPFNVSNWHPEDLPEGDPRLFGPKEEFTTDGSANYMWMQTFWSHLSKTGTAGVVMANGAMTSNTKGEKKVRQHMVDNSMVDAIVRMPDKLFLTTGIPACLFILSKNRDGKDGTQRERKGEILFIDASKMGSMVSRKLRVFSDEDVSKIADTYHNWRSNPVIASEAKQSHDKPVILSEVEESLPKHEADDTRSLSGVEVQSNKKPVIANGVKQSVPYADIDGFCKAATLADVQKQDYKLTPGIYVGSEAEVDDGIPFETKMADLKAQLLTQFEKSEELKKQIVANFEKL